MQYKENFGDISTEALEKKYHKSKTAFITALLVALLILLVDIVFIGPDSNVALSGFMGAFIGLAVAFGGKTTTAKRALNKVRRAD
jgi:hypothetical protein